MEDDKSKIIKVSGKKDGTVEVRGPSFLPQDTGRSSRQLLGTFKGKNAMKHALIFANAVRELYDAPEGIGVDPGTSE